MAVKRRGMTRLRQFLRAEDGATAVEYGLIAALIGMFLIGALSVIGSSINDKFTIIQTTVANAGS